MAKEGKAEQTFDLAEAWKMPSDQQLCHISKAPDHIRSSNLEHYKPLAFPVGPYHARAGVSAPEKAHRLKEQCVSEVVELSGRNRHDFREQMRSVLDRAKEYYTDQIGMDDEALERMLLLDGCFVLVSLRGTERLKQLTPGWKAESSESSESSDDRCSDCSEQGDEENQIAAANNGGGAVDSWHHFNVARDLFLAENQIPFFVVQKIYELLVKNRPYAERSVVGVVEAYVREVMAVYAEGADAQPPADHVHHLLHLSHLHLRPRIRQSSSWSDDGKRGGGATVGRLRRATQLRELMVRFKNLEMGGKAAPAGSILDVTFRGGGVLEIPRLEIDGGTWRQMANLILLEQGSPHVGFYVTAYCAFMSQLAGTAEDVALLCESGVIEHQLGSDGDVADGFRKLCDGIIFDADDDTYNYLRPVYQALEEHCRSRTLRLLCWVRGHANCPNPWLLLGMVAIIALLCFIVQQLQHATLRKNAT